MALHARSGSTMMRCKPFGTATHSLCAGNSAALTSRRDRRQVTVQARQYAVNVGLHGRKAGMMSWFTPEGQCLPATVIQVEPGNIVTQVKTEDTDGYNAVQVGYEVVAEKKLSKPELGHLAKAGAPPLRHLTEFKLKDRSLVEKYQPGEQLKLEDILKDGDIVDVSGTSIGKGFQGTVKKYGHKRGSMTHGSKSHREHGSIGPGTTPGRVYPGLKMASPMGNERVTIRKLKILKVDPERSAIVVKGSVPGKSGTLLEIAPAKLVGRNFKPGVNY